MVEQIPTGPRGRGKGDPRPFPSGTLAYDNWSYQHNSPFVNSDIQQQQLLYQNPMYGPRLAFGSADSFTFGVPMMGGSGGITSLPAGGQSMQVSVMSQLPGPTGTQSTGYITPASIVPQTEQAVYGNSQNEQKSQSKKSGRESPTAFIERVLTEKRQEERMQRDKERERESAARAERGDHYSHSNILKRPDRTEVTLGRSFPTASASSFPPSLNPPAVPQRGSPIATVSNILNGHGNTISHDPPSSTEYIHPERKRIIDGGHPDSDIPWNKTEEFTERPPGSMSATRSNSVRLRERRMHKTLPIREKNKSIFRSTAVSSAAYSPSDGQSSRETISPVPKVSSDNSKRVQSGDTLDLAVKRLKTLGEIKKIEEANRKLTRENQSIQAELHNELEVTEMQAKAKQRQADKEKKLHAQEQQLKALELRHERLRRENAGLKLYLEQAKTTNITLAEGMSLTSGPRPPTDTTEIDKVSSEQPSIEPAVNTGNDREQEVIIKTEPGAISMSVVKQNYVHIKQEKI